MNKNLVKDVGASWLIDKNAYGYNRAREKNAIKRKSTSRATHTHTNTAANTYRIQFNVHISLNFCYAKYKCEEVPSPVHRNAHLFTWYLADFLLHLYDWCNENSIKFSFNAISNCTHEHNLYNFSSGTFILSQTSVMEQASLSVFLSTLRPTSSSTASFSFSFRTFHVIIRHERWNIHF